MPTMKNRESSFDKDKRERSEHASEAKRSAPKSTPSTKEAKGSIPDKVREYATKQSKAIESQTK